MSLGERFTFRDIMEQIESLSVPVPDEAGKLAESFTRIPPLAHKLRWCEIPMDERGAVIARLRELAEGFTETGAHSPMAGYISRNLDQARQTLEFSMQHAHNPDPQRAV